MKKFHFIKKLFTSPAPEELPSQSELEIIFDVQIVKDDVWGAIGTLSKLGRPLEIYERMSLIQGCIKNKKFGKAFYLTRGLPANEDKKILLDSISKKAAFGDDYSTARSAALLSERIKLH